MPIVALPENTVRLLGSAAAISTPVDVIKELLDNALDAEATSVEILVSQNIIDRIEVRDNGHGIQADDYNSLGCMGHTSKLTSFEELRTFGGRTLGFRGQALASANSMGRITVITRCVGDPTAVKLTLCADIGGIESQQRISAPVGTTVIVTGLFSRIPVREQVAEKEVQKNLAKAKHIFQAYALARPTIRLSLKVLSGDIKQNWSYSPRPGAGVREAVVQVFGAGVVSECMLKTDTNKAASLTEDDAHGGSKITIEAVLPKPGADLSKLSKGSFFSVDSRPVSTSRGTMKKLVSNLKLHFKNSLGVDAEDRRLSDLFTCVNFKCPPGTYDPNIEPSKSQVLFGDESQLVGQFEALCSNTYRSRKAAGAFATIERRPLTKRVQMQTPPPSSDGPHDPTEPSAPHPDEPSQVEHVRQPAISEENNPKEFLLGSLALGVMPPQQVGKRPRAPESCATGHPQPLHSVIDFPTHEAVQERHLTESMNLFEPLVEATHEPEPSMEHMLAVLRNGAHKQPHSPVETGEVYYAAEVVPDQASPCHGAGRKRKFVVNMSADPDLSSDEEVETCGYDACDLQERISPQEVPCGNSKEGLNPWTIARMTAPARQTAADDTAADSAGRRLVQAEEPPVPAEPFEEELPILRPHMGAPRDLDTPRVRRFAMTHMDHLQDPDVSYPDASSSLYPQTNTQITARDLPQSPSYKERSTQRRQLPDIRPYSNTREDVIDRDGLIQTTLSFDEPRLPQHDGEVQAQLHINDVPTRRNPPFRKPKRVQQRDRGQTFQDADINSEREKHSVESRNANKIAKKSMTDRGFASSHSPNPRPVNSGNGHVGHLPTAKQPDRGYTEINMFDGDSRKYLIRRQRSEAAHRRNGRQSIKRTKSDKLPLETIPSGDGTEQLVLHLSQETAKTCIASRRTPSLPAYHEEVRFGELMSLEDVDDIQSKLQTIVTTWTERIFGKKADIEFDLRKAVKGTDVAA